MADTVWIYTTSPLKQLLTAYPCSGKEINEKFVELIDNIVAHDSAGAYSTLHSNTTDSHGWLYAAGGAAALLLVILLFAKRRKKDEDDED